MTLLKGVWLVLHAQLALETQITLGQNISDLVLFLPLKSLAHLRVPLTDKIPQALEINILRQVKRTKPFMEHDITVPARSIVSTLTRASRDLCLPLF